MSIEEKAKELVEKFKYATRFELHNDAKQCAIICCEEITKTWRQDDGIHFSITADYWQSVKQFIETKM